MVISDETIIGYPSTTAEHQYSLEYLSGDPYEHLVRYEELQVCYFSTELTRYRPTSRPLKNADVFQSLLTSSLDKWFHDFVFNAQEILLRQSCNIKGSHWDISEEAMLLSIKILDRCIKILIEDLETENKFRLDGPGFFFKVVADAVSYITHLKHPQYCYLIH